VTHQPKHRRSRIALRSAAILLVLFATSCFERQLAPVDPCTRTTVGENIRVEGIDSLDLLFLIDSSPTMVEEQAAIRAQIPRLVQILTSGDLQAGTTNPGVGVMDFQPVASMHLGVITQDGGGLGRAGAGICPSQAGDDGLLSMPEATSRRVASPGCPATGLPLFLDFQRGVTDVPTLISQFTCQTELGTGGCGFEQDLEMIMKAVADPAYVPPTGPYLSGTPSHGGTGENAGFLRANSVLAVVIVTDEDDGSVSNADIFDPNIAFTPNDLNVRVPFNTDYQQPIQRYIDALRVVEPIAEQLIVISIVGVPTDLVNDVANGEGSSNLTAVLADPRMTNAVSPASPSYLVAACSSASGEAYPARRIVEFTQQVGGVVQSICQTDFGPAIDILVNRIANVLGGACLPRQLNPDADGNVDCDVLEVLPNTGPTTHCGDLPHPTAYDLLRTEVASDGTMREVCRVHQVGRAGAGTASGWVYDDDTLGSFSNLPMGCTQRIAFSQLDPVTGAEIRSSATRPFFRLRALPFSSARSARRALTTRRAPTITSSDRPRPPVTTARRWRATRPRSRATSSTAPVRSIARRTPTASAPACSATSVITALLATPSAR